MNAFYFVRRSQVKAEEVRQAKRFKKDQLQSSKKDDSNFQESSDDEANVGVDEIVLEKTSIERTLSIKSEKKTKALVELTSQNRANKITEEDSEFDSLTSESDDQLFSEAENNYNDLRAISVAEL